MAKSRKGIWTFLISLIISFIILSIVFSLFFLYAKFQEVDSSQNDIPYKEIYKPRNEESINIIFIGCEQLYMPPTLITMLTYDAPNGTVSITALPPSALVTIGVKTDTIAAHYDYEGIRGGVNAVKNLLLADADRYVRLDKQGIANLVDFLGGIEYDLPQAITCGNDIFAPGKQLLDGRRVAAIMLSDSISEQARVSLQSDLAQAIVQQHFAKSLIQKYNGFITAFFNNSETNLNQYDFALRQKGMFQYLENASLVVNKIGIAGDFNQLNTEFTPTQQSIQSAIDTIASIFSDENT